MSEHENENTEPEITEPENSTVDDWAGQNIARDQEVADRAVEENDTLEEAEAQFDEEAEGEQKFREGHDRPDGIDAEGDAVGRGPE